MNFIIKEATIDNATEIDNLLTELIQYEKKYDSNINKNHIVKSLFKRLMLDESKCVFIALNNQNEIIGYLHGYIKSTGSAYINNVTILDSIFVKKEYRNSGIGKDLIEEFKKWSKSKNASYIELNVQNENDNAKQLYKKQGFTDMKTIMSFKLDV